MIIRIGRKNRKRLRRRLTMAQIHRSIVVAESHPVIFDGPCHECLTSDKVRPGMIVHPEGNCPRHNH